MPGMLSEGIEEQQPPAQAPAPAAAPPAQAPPSSGPDPEIPPAGETPAIGSPGPEHSAGPLPPFEQLRDEAIKLVYGDRFDQLIGMFQKNGPDKFARSVAITVNTAISELEKKHGVIPPEEATKVGMSIYMRILEDMLGGEDPPVPDVPMEQIQETLPAILIMYQQYHPDVTKEDLQAVIIDATKKIAESDGKPNDIPEAEGIMPEGGQLSKGTDQAPDGAKPKPVEDEGGY
jgi:hypothetical protein